MALMIILPFFLTRLSGESYETITSLNLSHAPEILRKIIEASGFIEQLKPDLINSLFQTIERIDNDKSRRAAINLKRDIFNEREIKEESLKTLSRILPDEIKLHLKDLIKRKADLEKLLAEGEQIYSDECRQLRKRFRQITKNEKFQSGLILSSKTLLKEINHEFLSASDSPITRNVIQLERGIIKYLSRMCLKTSPYSVYTHVLAGEMTNKLNDSTFVSVSNRSSFPGESLQYKSCVNLNNKIYRFLLDALVKSKEISGLSIKPNPIIARVDNKFLFLVIKDNIEAVHTIPINKLTDFCYHATGKKNERIDYRKLSRNLNLFLRDNSLNVNAEEFIDKLISLGFLEFDLGLSAALPNWENKFLKFLEKRQSDSKTIEALRESVIGLKELVGGYPFASVEQKLHSLETSYRKLQTVLGDSGNAFSAPFQKYPNPGSAQSPAGGSRSSNKASGINSLKNEQLIYEDTYSDLEIFINENQINALISTVQEFFDQIDIFEPNLEVKMSLGRFFIGRYGRNKTVDFKNFYFDYYLEKKLSQNKDVRDWHLFHRKVIASELSDYSEYKTLQKRRNKFAEIFLNLLSKECALDSDQINIGLDVFKRTKKLADRKKAPNSHSLDKNEIAASTGVFLQFFYDGNNPRQIKGVLNLAAIGLGKLISRFLYCLDAKLKQAIYNSNSLIQDDAILAEIQDCSLFNANVHPPLLPREITTSYFNQRLKDERQIPLSQLAVRINEQGTLELIDKSSQKKIIVCDLGMENIKFRSSIYQILSKFTLRYPPKIDFILKILNDFAAASRKENSQTTAKVLPQITINNQIVIQRKSWIIPSRIIPKKLKSESDWSYYYRISRWKEDSGLPDEVFLSFDSDDEVIADEKTERQNDNRKPQYICFSNPFLLGLFEKLTRNASTKCKFVEMLPSSDNLLKINDKRYVTEHYLQWYA